MEAHYRFSRPEDFEAIFGLLRQLWPNKEFDQRETYQVFMRGLVSPHDFLVTALSADQVIGFGCMVIKNSFWQESFVGYVTTLVVDEAFRNRGVGKTLLDRLEEIAARHSCRRLELDSGFHREASHQFYEQIGFQKRAFLFSKEIG